MKQENVRATVTDNSAFQSCKKKINQNYLTLSPYNLTTVIHIIGVCVCVYTYRSNNNVYRNLRGRNCFIVSLRTRSSGIGYIFCPLKDGIMAVLAAGDGGYREKSQYYLSRYRSVHP